MNNTYFRYQFINSYNFIICITLRFVRQTVHSSYYDVYLRIKRIEQEINQKGSSTFLKGIFEAMFWTTIYEFN